MGCVIVEGDSLAPFTALKNSQRNIMSGTRYSLLSLYNLSLRWSLKKASAVVWDF